MVMPLSQIVRQLEVTRTRGDLSVDISDVAYDSRKVGPGFLFAAVPGVHLDGRQFIPAALEAGASAVLTQEPCPSLPGEFPVIEVPRVREAMSLVAAILYGRPAEAMKLIGLTGTNGKTTTVWLLESILAEAGFTPGVLGTVSVRFGGRQIPSDLTTPEGPDLQKWLAAMRRSQVDHVAMEVSSHALDQGRVAGCRFAVAVFTNLTQDHLDYHGNLAAYFEAKKLLFSRYLDFDLEKPAVVNVDDEWGRTLARELGPKALTYSLSGPADVQVQGFEGSRAGIRARISFPGAGMDLESRLIGEFNLYNLLAASAVGWTLGLSPDRISAGLAKVKGVPGRLERVGTQDSFLALVDYAHTPDALERVLTAVSELKPKRLWTVFGCGGDRDRNKRPIMGQAVGRLSHLAVVTSDNPRTEDPQAIIRDIESGLLSLGLQRKEPDTSSGTFPPGSYVVVPDRREAIGLAVRLMGPGDILVVAGKGHEDYQILGREKVHFDDAEEVAAALRREGKF